MQRSSRVGSALLLLGLIGPGAAGLLFFASATRAPRAPPSPEDRAELPVDPGRVPVPPTPAFRSEREPVPEHRLRERSAGETALSARAKARGPRKEREFLAAFLAMERAEPGALSSRAEAVLGGGGPPSEKVALLRALDETRSKERLHWLEHATRTLPDDSGPQGVSVASFALDELAAAALLEREARPALLRIAFETRGLAPALRRRAAVGFARSGDELELDGLRVPLAREADELLVAGVLAALRERTECPRAALLVDACSSPRESAPAAPAE